MMNGLGVELRKWNSFKQFQRSETEDVDISLETVAMATLCLADISKLATFEPMTSECIISMYSNGNDTWATSDRCTAVTTTTVTSSRTLSSSSDSCLSQSTHQRPVNGLFRVREDAIMVKTSERELDDETKSNNSQYLKKRYN